MKERRKRNGKKKAVLALALALLIVVGIIPMDSTEMCVKAADKIYGEDTPTLPTYSIEPTYNEGRYLVPVADGKYPVVIFLHGSDGQKSVETNNFRAKMEKWVSSGFVDPVILIMPTIQQIQEPAYGQDDFRDFVSEGYLEDLVNFLKDDTKLDVHPWKKKIDKTKVDTIVGVSMGGAAAMYAGMKLPKIFKNVGGFSPAQCFYMDGATEWYWVRDNELLNYSNDQGAHMMLAYGEGEIDQFSHPKTGAANRYFRAINRRESNQNKFLMYHAPKTVNGSQQIGHGYLVFFRELFCYLYYLKYNALPTAELIEQAMGYGGDFPSQDPDLQVSKKRLLLQDTISISFMVPKSAINGKYHDPYLVVTHEGADTKLTEYVESGDMLVFTYRVVPYQIGDEVSAVPYALREDGSKVIGVPIRYSVADYCYSLLSKEDYQGSKYATLRRLLVDILRYGDAAQMYQDYRANVPASGNLTSAQNAMGTDVNAAMTYNTVKEQNYKTVSSAEELAKIESAMLFWRRRSMFDSGSARTARLTFAW